jgi:ABC-type transporter Mla MlaB component
MAANRAGTVACAIGGPIDRDALPGLCDRFSAMLEDTTAAIALCDVSQLAADAVTVDALARLALAARRRGAQIRLVGASESLRGLIAFTGLQDVLKESR